MKKENQLFDRHLENRLSYFLKYHYYIIIAIVLFLNSCKKQDGFVIMPSSQESKSVNIYKQYVDSLNINDSAANYLVQSLKWNSLKVINVDSNKRVVFVPINLRNKNSVVNGLVFIESLKSNTIINSYYTQIVNIDNGNARSESTASQYELTTAANIVSDYFTRRKNSFNGSINFYNMHNSFLYSLGYEKGTAKYFKSINKSAKGTNGNIKSNSSCVNYYLTTYYDDGSSETEFLFTSCDPCRQQSKISTTGEAIVANECGTSYTGGIGGGGGSDGSSAAALDLWSFFSNYGTLKYISSTKKLDGSTIYEFEDDNLMLVTRLKLIFILDRNNVLVEGSQQLIISGLISFSQNTTQSSLFTYSRDFGYVSSANLSFKIEGLLNFRAFDFVSDYYKMNINITLPQSNMYVPTGTISYISLTPIFPYFNK